MAEETCIYVDVQAVLTLIEADASLSFADLCEVLEVA